MKTEIKTLNYLCKIKIKAVMDLQADLKWILNELKDVKDPTLIEALKSMLKYRKKVKRDLLEDQKRISIEQYNKELEISEKEIESGNFYTQEQVQKRISQWGRQ